MRWADFDQETKRHYWVWAEMIRRCTNPKNRRYEDYGGRGIEVCDRWRSFDSFIEDMGMRPSPRFTLERLNNNAGYNPQNCCWAPRSHQAKNKRRYRVKTNSVCGVNPVRGRWRARIRVNGKSFHLGYFDHLDAAVLARIEAMKIHGFSPTHGR